MSCFFSPSATNVCRVSQHGSTVPRTISARPPESVAIAALAGRAGLAKLNALLIISGGLSRIPLDPLTGTVLVDPTIMILGAVLMNTAGNAVVSIKIPTSIGGVTLYSQALDLDLSNAVLMRISR